MRLTEAGGRSSLAMAAALHLLLASAAMAEPPSQAAAEDPVSVEDRKAAADAYDKGTAAYLSADYALAAHWFEHAYRRAPTSTALLQAVRARHRAGQELRAANLALLLQEKYPGDPNARALTDTVIRPAKQNSLLVHASCDEDCALEVDGEVSDHRSFFVTPEEEHSIKAEYEHGETKTTVRGPAGSSKTVQLAAPPPPPGPPVPRWAFFTSLGATLAAGATTIWSGIDANKGVDAYEDAAAAGDSTLAQSLYEDGQSKEKRTNALIGTTAGMCAVTAVLGVFTDWKGRSKKTEKRSVEPTLGFDDTGGFAAVRGRF